MWLSFIVGAILTTGTVTFPVDDQRANTDIVLHLEELSKYGDPAKVIKMIQDLAGGLHGCGIKEIPRLKRHFLTNRTVTCNDGSPAGYYIRQSYGSKRWIVYLEGGGYCFDQLSCHGRWLNSRKLMSSNEWPETKEGTGILSWHPEENPYFYHANIVYVPYCSSDSWSGHKMASGKGEFSFLGSLIVQEVIKDLLNMSDGLSDGNKLYLAGSSAGGTGVLLNLDSVADLVHQKAPNIEVRGIADSGWFLDNEPFKVAACTEYSHICSPTEAIKRGIFHWGGKVPQACKESFPGNQQWSCYFGYNIYPTLNTPVFVIQYLFDEAQITADHVGTPVNKEQWHYIHNLGNDIRNTLENVSATFAPACYSHKLLTKKNWQNLKISGHSLPQALRCWEESTSEANHYDQKDASARENSEGDGTNLQGDDPRSNKRRHKKNKKGRRRGRKDKNRERNREDRQRSQRSLDFLQDSDNIHAQHHRQHHSNQCVHHLIDNCGWPQCNLSCPKLTNPYTGEEIDFIDLLIQFGIDLSSIANALNMDLATMQAMDHETLLKILTQQQ
ncbi:palmitoleoyl-protein carboxylesterase notum1 isoform X2 [Lingula anatina]|uniref:Palmitoleoyl-protein carboxylesterase notum1 isoform X2 n=1 Tax=Lingula anatina TaxID=7574 RepID=A0A1S3KHM8_LINAN|nr:palmitoleoyl-protein carboxylesterase notum1 isoform X2 [Lingula anatina]|eukprot:XP_013422007.1 palmitoleoyl-protein carboxylesterase notum1 isoform X2 [Lingula anatina]